MEYPEVEPDEWVQPVRRNYRAMCCNCGLVHRINFRLVKRGKGHVIQFQAFRDEKETKSVHKRKK